VKVSQEQQKKIDTLISFFEKNNINKEAIQFDQCSKIIDFNSFVKSHSETLKNGVLSPHFINCFERLKRLKDILIGKIVVPIPDSRSLSNKTLQIEQPENKQPVKIQPPPHQPKIERIKLQPPPLKQQQQQQKSIQAQASLF
jgi:hypothetical protein